MKTLVYGTSVRGDSHYICGTECQDSNSFSESDFSDDAVKVIAVSDGHGNALYRRSAQGSAFAVDIAKRELYNFVNRESALLDEITVIQRIIDAPPPQLLRQSSTEAKTPPSVKQATFDTEDIDVAEDTERSEVTEDPADTERSESPAETEATPKSTAELLLLKDRVQALEEIILKDLETVKENIIAEWNNAVDRAFSSEPIYMIDASIREYRSISDEPRSEAFTGYGDLGEGKISFKTGSLNCNALKSLISRPRLLYGATLIAAAQYKEHNFILQLGDGDATVIFEDGRVEAPVQNSGRVSGNETYSLCQNSALSHFRSVYLRDDIGFIMINTDGISDALEDKGALFDIATELRKTVDEDASVFREELTSLLRHFSSGSGDDCSVCFIAKGVSEEAYGQIKSSAAAEDKAPNLPYIPLFENYALNRELYRISDTDAKDTPYYSEVEMSNVGREAIRNSLMKDRYVDLIESRQQLEAIPIYRKLLIDIFKYGKQYLDNEEDSLNVEQEETFRREIDRILSEHPIRILSFRSTKVEMDDMGEISARQSDERTAIILSAKDGTLEIADISKNTFNLICNDLSSLVSFNGTVPITEEQELEINNYRITVKKEK